MKFICDRDTLNEAVNIVAKAAPLKSTIPALEGIKAEVKKGLIKLSAYDFNIAICSSFETEITEEGVIVFPAKLICDIVRRLPSGKLTIEADETYQIKISCGGSLFNIMGVSPDDFPELPGVESKNRIDISCTAFKKLVKQTTYAASTLDIKPILTGILFELHKDEGILSTVGVDQYRLAMKREKVENTEGDITSFIVPAKNLNELMKILPEEDEANIHIYISGKNVMFGYNRFILISRTLEGEFLNYKSVIPAESKFDVRVKTRDLRGMIDRASLITSNAIKSPIRCDFDFDSIRISTASNLGRFSDIINVDNFNEKLTVGFNNKYMLDALSACECDEILIRMNTELTPILIEPAKGDDFLFMVLPMRLNLDIK